MAHHRLYLYYPAYHQYDRLCQADRIVEYLQWSLNDAGAASIASKLGYAVLPEAVKAKVLDAYKLITCNGQPVVK